MAKVAGIDAGFQTVKAVIMENDQVVASVIVEAGNSSFLSVAQRALDQAKEKAGITSANGLAYIAATGVGRGYVTFANEQLPELVCLPKGAHRLIPTARLVLDIGAEKCVIVKCMQGKPLNFAQNDKCASGSGRYIEMAAKILDMKLADVGEAALRSEEKVEISSTCAVFAESEIISLVHQQKRREDILMGIHRGIAIRTFSMFSRLGIQNDVVFCGGVARNPAAVKAIEEQIKVKVLVPETPEIVGALGAAIIASEKGGANK